MNFIRHILSSNDNVAFFPHPDISLPFYCILVLKYYCDAVGEVAGCVFYKSSDVVVNYCYLFRNMGEEIVGSVGGCGGSGGVDAPIFPPLV
jgi:hypothetical protein